MSLLNDALRKRRGERQRIEEAPGTSGPKPGATDSNARQKVVRLAVVGVLVLASVSCVTWLYQLAPDRPMGQKQSVSSLAIAALTQDSVKPDPTGKPSRSADAETPRPIPATATTKAAAAAAPLPPPQAPPPKQTPAAKPLPVKSKSSPKAQVARRPEKSKAASRPRSKAQPQRAAKSGGAQRRAQSEPLYRKARQYHRQDRLEQAIALYQEVIKIDPDHANARFNLAAAYLQTESFDNAYFILIDLYRKEPGNHQAMLNLALANIGRRRFDEALALLDKAAATPEPPLFEIALHKGIAYNHLNRTQDALEWYKRAEALRPDDPRLLFNLAVVSDQQHHYDTAIDYYQRHIDQSPGMNAAKKREISRRIRMLQAYHTQLNPEESNPR
jgi:Flp pilus assembly protein TadD